MYVRRAQREREHARVMAVRREWSVVSRVPDRRLRLHIGSLRTRSLKARRDTGRLAARQALAGRVTALVAVPVMYQ